MTRYLLDTTALIDYSQGYEPARSRLLAMIAAGEVLGICAINVAEFYSGLPAATRPVWGTFLESLPYWDISRAAAAKAGEFRYDFARRGIQLTTADTLIAAVAAEQDAIIVTNNPRHYPMAGIRILEIRPP